MTKALALATGIVMALPLAACNQTGTAVPRAAARMAAQFDPTGLSTEAMNIADGVGSMVDIGVDEPSAPDLGMFAPRLRDVAAGRTARPNMMASVDGKIAEVMALQTMGLVSSITGAAAAGALTGGAALAAAAPGIAMQAAMSGAMSAQMVSAQGQAREALAQAEAQRAAERVVPDEDRPAEAQAILSIIDGPSGRSATWQNPETGASGRVTVQAVSKREIPQEFNCRLVKQEWKSGQEKRSGSMAVCRSGGEWYDLS